MHQDAIDITHTRQAPVTTGWMKESSSLTLHPLLQGGVWGGAALGNQGLRGQALRRQCILYFLRVVLEIPKKGMSQKTTKAPAKGKPRYDEIISKKLGNCADPLPRGRPHSREQAGALVGPGRADRSPFPAAESPAAALNPSEFWFLHGIRHPNYRQRLGT